MGDRSRFLNINGANYRQIGFTSYIPDNGKVYGIRRNGDIQVADLVEVTSGDTEGNTYTKEEIDAKLAALSSQAQAESPWTLINTAIILTNTEVPAWSDGTYTSLKIDLSSYLPNDENYYEVLLSMRVAATSSSNPVSIWGAYDFITPELPEMLTTTTHPVQIISSTGTAFAGGLFHWFTGPRRILQIWSTMSVAASIKNLCLSGYKKIPQPVVVYEEAT